LLLLPTRNIKILKNTTNHYFRELSKRIEGTQFLSYLSKALKSTLKMKSLIQEAQRLNNEGVRLLLLENREQQAVTYLTQSLNMVKHLLAIVSDDNSRSSSNPSNVAINSELLAHSLPNLQDSESFICCSLLAFSVAEASEALPSEDTIQVYSAVIILNIALAYHRKGVSGSEASVARAKKLYGMVTKILSGCDNNKGVALVAKLAAVNNLSLLQHSQGEYNSSQQGFQYLRDLIDVASEDLEGSPLLHSTKMYEGMLLNILCVGPSDAAPAA
jgi:hypothetical protein